MKAICNSALLAEAMSVVSRALSSKAVMPVLEGVLVRAREGCITLSCTDLRMGIETVIPAQVQEEGDLVLQGRLFAEITRRLPDAMVELRTEDRSGETMAGALITAPGLRTRLFIMDASDFPALPQVEDAQRVTLPAATLKALIRQTAFAAGMDDSRVILTGVLLELTQGRCRFVALDGFRLAMSDAPYDGEVTMKAVIPSATLHRLLPLLGDEGNATLEISPTHVGMSLEGTRLVSRLLEGEYIRYEQIIPGEWTTSVNAPCSALSAALDRAVMLAREGRNNIVRLKISQDIMAVTSTGESGDTYEEIPVTTDGRELEIAFNARYLIDIFKNMEGEQVVMNFTTNVSPCVIHSAASSASTYLVLPVRIYGA